MAPLTQRAKNELETVRKFSDGVNPFPYFDIKRSFATAKRLAGIENLHFHDLGRTAITRWINEHIPLAIAGKLAGHSKPETTMKHYISTDVEMVSKISAKLNDYHSQIMKIIEIESEMIN
jgi:integrase